MLRFLHALVFALAAVFGIASGVCALGSETALRENFATAPDRVGAFGSQALGTRQQNPAVATTIASECCYAARGVGSVPANVGTISRINPTGCTTNCVNAAIATERTLAGAATSAVPGGPVAAADVAAVLEAQFGRALPSFSAAGRGEITRTLGAIGDGTRAIIVGEGASGAHAFNGVMSGGRLVLLDGQLGTTASLSGYSSFRVFITNF